MERIILGRCRSNPNGRSGEQPVVYTRCKMRRECFPYAKIVGRKTIARLRLRMLKRQRGRWGWGWGRETARRYDGGICCIRRRSTRTSTTWFPCILLNNLVARAERIRREGTVEGREGRDAYAYTRDLGSSACIYVSACFPRGTRVCTSARTHVRVLLLPASRLSRS